MIWVYIALGGAAGALARYTVARRVTRRAGGTFPWGTLCVNAVGAFALGLVLTTIEGTSRRPELAALLAVGFLGDFTTFSTYAYEAVAQLRERRWRRAAGYVLGTMLLGVAACAAGAGLGLLLHR